MDLYGMKTQLLVEIFYWFGSGHRHLTHPAGKALWGLAGVGLQEVLGNGTGRGEQGPEGSRPGEE